MKVNAIEFRSALSSMSADDELKSVLVMLKNEYFFFAQQRDMYKSLSNNPLKRTFANVCKYIKFALNRVALVEASYSPDMETGEYYFNMELKSFACHLRNAKDCLTEAQILLEGVYNVYTINFEYRHINCVDDAISRIYRVLRPCM